MAVDRYAEMLEKFRMTTVGTTEHTPEGEIFSWRDGHGVLHTVEINEEVKLNRKRAVQALRTADESLRCSGEVFEETWHCEDNTVIRTGRMCAIGAIYTALGIQEDSMNLTYSLFGAGPGSIYELNDGYTGPVSAPRWQHSWSHIADVLAERWGIE